MVKIFLMAYQSFEMIQLSLKCLKTLSGVGKEDIVVIDMGIDGEVKPWLESQCDLSYLCAKKLENYARILNVAIAEFTTTEHILILNANSVYLGDCVSRLEELCANGQKIGAVIPTDIASFCDQKLGLRGALEAVRQGAAEPGMELSMKLPCGCLFLSRNFIDEIGPLDEQFILPESIMLDYSLRGLSQKWKFMRMKDVFFFAMAPHTDEYAAFYGEMVDRMALKKKWGMNYLSGMPNENLVGQIERQEKEAFTLLEIGCDCGANLMRIKNLYPNARLFAIEINPAAAKIASCFGEVRNGNIEEENLPYPEHMFDYIVCGDVLEHLRDPEQAIRYCKRFLKPGGGEAGCLYSQPDALHGASPAA